MTVRETLNIESYISAIMKLLILVWFAQASEVRREIDQVPGVDWTE